MVTGRVRRRRALIASTCIATFALVACTNDGNRPEAAPTTTTAPRPALETFVLPADPPLPVDEASLSERPDGSVSWDLLYRGEVSACDGGTEYWISVHPPRESHPGQDHFFGPAEERAMVCDGLEGSSSHRTFFVSARHEGRSYHVEGTAPADEVEAFARSLISVTREEWIAAARAASRFSAPEDTVG